MPDFQESKTVPEFLFVWLKRLLPGTALSRFAGLLAQSQHPRLSQILINYFLSRHAVNLAEAANPDPRTYPSFNAFFTRALRDGVRPLASTACVCPADGVISQLGHIQQDQIFQAKGQYYSTLALLGGDSMLAAQFENGSFCTIYLSPKDYHRVHMPCQGRLTSMTYVPGQLLSVNPANARHVPGLFARNERVVCAFDSPNGPFVMVLVGATIVGSIATAWHGTVNLTHSPHLQHYEYANQSVDLTQGQEMGRFMLGSTVILLFPRDRITFPSGLHSGSPVKLGEAISIL
ncbi:MAG: archaetidylserine decarboxylase [Betaproteobacteria bacterium]|nr:archaetidylserine decarboxylase [Betaproteobacteria bacterium]